MIQGRTPEIMKASEVLKRYQAGERNFQRVNLRGESFKGKDLSGADFSEADIRSTNFTGANLRWANFTGAKCGLQKRWVTLLVLLSWLLAGISGLGSFVTMFFVMLLSDPDLTTQILGLVGLILVLILLILILHQGLNTKTIIVSVVVPLVVSILLSVLIFLPIGLPLTVFYFVPQIAALTFIVAFALAGAITGALAVVLIGIVTERKTVAVAVTIATTVAVAVSRAAEVVEKSLFIKAVTEVAVITAAIAVVAGVGLYIGWRALNGEKKDAWLRTLAIACAVRGGTSFRGADLTDADFTRARLKSADLRKAIITGVCWNGAQSLDRVRSRELKINL